MELPRCQRANSWKHNTERRRQDTSHFSCIHIRFPRNPYDPSKKDPVFENQKQLEELSPHSKGAFWLGRDYMVSFT